MIIAWSAGTQNLAFLLLDTFLLRCYICNMLVKHIDLNENNDDPAYPQEREEIPTPTYSRRKKSKFKSMRQWFFRIFAVIFVMTGTYFVLSYREDKVTPLQHFQNIAGESINRTTKLLNPSKTEKRYYSTLIMGIDTRGVEFNGEEYVPVKRDGTRKIDVIMQVLYDRQTNKVSFISIPRDTSLTVTEECMHQEREDQKYINRIYDMAEKNNCPQSGPEMMMKYVSYMTGYEIDNYAIVTLDSFVQLLDIVGEDYEGKKGIWIDVPRNMGDYCPNDRYGYDYVYYPEGRQFLTSKQALCYVRVRKTSSDFDRNRRQQELIDNISHLIISNDTLKNPIKLYEIYNSFKGDMQMSSISLQDITLGLEIMQEADLSNIQKIVLDHEFAGTNALLTKPLYSPPGTHTRPGGYYLIPTAWDQDCCKNDEWKLVRDYLHKIIEDPNYEAYQASVYTYVNKYTNGKAVFKSDTYEDLKAQLEQEYIYMNESKYALAMYSDGPDVQVYDFSGGSKNKLAQKIAQISGGMVYDGSLAPFERLNQEEIAVLIRIP